MRIGRHRSPAQDFEFGIAQIVEIAIRALSPAVNDTFTGVACVDWLGEALLLAARSLPSGGSWRDDTGTTRLTVRPLRLARIIRLAFDQIRQAAGDNPAVLIRLLETIARLRPSVIDADATSALLDEANAVRDASTRGGSRRPRPRRRGRGLATRVQRWVRRERARHGARMNQDPSDPRATPVPSPPVTIVADRARAGSAKRSLADLVIGRRLASTEEDGQRIGPLTGVAVLGLDALSSAAYGPEAALTLLLPLGAAGIAHLVPLTALIVGILFLVYLSYRQTIRAYPNGGGSYTVVKENLGQRWALLAGAALAIDYVLNVAVGISAGVGALVSALPSLQAHSLGLCLGILGLLTLVNLRGTRESGLTFLLPTYLFVGTLVLVLTLGGVRAAMSGGHPVPVVAPPVLGVPTEVAGVWLLMRAFASGCTAMTGVEAVSNGVPVFRAPTIANANRTLSIIIALLVMLLGGVAFLSSAYGIGATDPGAAGYQSVLSQLTAAVLGRGALYYVTMGSIVAVLALSANTSFADFPRLCRVIALDRYLPDAFAIRGRRLIFSYGVVVLSVLAGALLVVFDGTTDRLIPLFAIGAFLAFTLSQAGMVQHWRGLGGAGKPRRAGRQRAGRVRYRGDAGGGGDLEIPRGSLDRGAPHPAARPRLRPRPRALRGGRCRGGGRSAPDGGLGAQADRDRTRPGVEQARQSRVALRDGALDGRSRAPRAPGRQQHLRAHWRVGRPRRRAGASGGAAGAAARPAHLDLSPVLRAVRRLCRARARREPGSRHRRRRPRSGGLTLVPRRPPQQPRLGAPRPAETSRRLARGGRQPPVPSRECAAMTLAMTTLATRTKTMMPSTPTRLARKGVELIAAAQQ